jgi:predicted dehydrogenase
MRKINISIVGTGLMGLQHIKAITKSNKANLHSILDISKNALNLSKRYKVPIYSNVSELLRAKDLDAVIIATPNQLHETHTVSFLEKKIPVLLEKPISNNIKSANKIIKSSKKNKTPLLIGYHRRHNSIVSKVKNIINSGKLGEIVSANVLCWLYKHKEYYKEKWRTNKGGGPLGINLVHDIDMICYLLGPIQYVQAFTANKTRKFKVEDTAIVSLIFKSGALCTLNISDTIVAPWSYELTAGENPAYPITNQSAYMIGGTKGSLQFPNLKNWFYKKKRSWWNKILVKEDKNKKDDNTLINQINHFADVVTKKVKPKVNGNDGLISLKIFAAITKSAKLGKKIKL